MKKNKISVLTKYTYQWEDYVLMFRSRENSRLIFHEESNYKGKQNPIWDSIPIKDLGYQESVEGRVGGLKLNLQGRHDGHWGGGRKMTQGQLRLHSEILSTNKKCTVTFTFSITVLWRYSRIRWAA